MIARWSVLALALAACGGALAPAVVGYSELSAPDPDGPTLAVGVWYPSAAAPTDESLGTFRQRVVRGGPVVGDHHPLVVISHGTSGSSASHYDTALALAAAGYIVLAPTHAGDNTRDQTAAGTMAGLVARPRQLHAVLDYALARWGERERIDRDRIAVFGFSLGAFGALVAVGGSPDVTRLRALCSDHPDAPECRFIHDRHGDQLDAAPPAPSAWVHDPRIRAAMIAAPAIGIVFDHGGLQDVHVPILLWRAELDRQAPDAWSSAIIARELPTPPAQRVAAGAGHFAFLAPCSDMLRRVAPAVCDDPAGFDRAAFHRELATTIVAFLRDALSQAR